MSAPPNTPPRAGSPFEVPAEGTGRPVLLQVKRALSPTALAITSPVRRLMRAVTGGARRAVGRMPTAAPVRTAPTRNLSAVELVSFETHVLEVIYEQILRHSKL